VSFWYYRWLISKRLLKAADESRDSRLGQWGGWVSIIVNVLLFISKLVVGLLIRSIALIGDAVHSFSDVATTVIVIVGYRISAKPPDRKHPFGHQRAEYIATLVIAVLLAVAGVEFMRGSVQRLQSPVASQVTSSAIVFVFLTILVKFWLGGFAKYIARQIDSQALRADALHHYTDAVSSALVLVAVVGTRLGYPQLDGFGGLAVGAILIWAGISIARSAADSLLGQAPPREMISKIQQICENLEEVINAHDIIVHNYGKMTFISLHIEVDHKNSCQRSHEIATRIEHEIAHVLDAHTIVHIDPVDLDSPVLQRIREMIESALQLEPQISSFHDLRIMGDQQQPRIFFDIVPDRPGVRKCGDLAACKSLRSAIRKQFPDYEVSIHIDQEYSNN